MADLGRLEAAVMDRLWSWDRPVVVREVLEDLQRERDIAYTTVMTVMDNLHKKGMLLRQRNGRAFVYRPTRSRAAHTAELMEEALSRSADRGTALMRFVEQLPADELIELRRLIDSVADDSASGKSG